MIRTVLRRLVVLSCLATLLIPIAAGQSTDDVPRATQTFVIENARIVQAPGRTIERGHVLVRGGLIEAVGPDVAIPPSAERVQGDTLTVYAGFIDGLAHTGLTQPDEAERAEQPERPGAPSFERAGILPARDVLDAYDPANRTVAAWREAGFTAAHVVPHGQMLPGKGALVLLGKGEAADQVVRRDASTLLQFEGAEGRVYPATTMAVIARFRDLYHEAARREQLDQRYEADPTGMERPPYDAAHAALFPIVEGEQPLFVRTSDALEIHRAIALQKELGFSMVLAGLQGAHNALDALEQADAPLFVSLDLPEAPDTSAADTVAAGEVSTALDSTRVVTPEQPGSFFVSDKRTHSYEDADAELENLKARQLLEREQYYALPANLRASGLPFGFSSLNTEAGDVHDHLRLMIEHGLAEEAALAALTTDAAAQLGIDRQLGTVEAGKMANLVLTDGSYFDEDTKVVMVVIDGRRYELDASADTPPAGSNASR